MTHEEIREALASAPAGTHVHAVLAAVLLHIGPKGEPCTASILTLSKIAGCKPRACRATLLVLADSVLARVSIPGRTDRFTWCGGSQPRQSTAAVADDPGSVEPQPRQSTAPEVKYRASNDAHRDDHALTLDSGTEPSEGPARAPARARQAPPNADLFEALVLGAGWTLVGLTKSQRGMTARHAKELAAVDATPEQIAAFCEAWARRLGNRPAPPTVSKHWNPEESNVVHLSAVERWKAHRAG